MPGAGDVNLDFVLGVSGHAQTLQKIATTKATVAETATDIRRQADAHRRLWQEQERASQQAIRAQKAQSRETARAAAAQARSAAMARKAIRGQRTEMAEGINIATEFGFAIGQTVPALQLMGVQLAGAGNTIRTLAASMGVLNASLIGIATFVIPQLIGVLFGQEDATEKVTKATEKATKSLEDYERQVKKAGEAARRAFLFQNQLESGTGLVARADQADEERLRPAVKTRVELQERLDALPSTAVGARTEVQLKLNQALRDERRIRNEVFDLRRRASVALRDEASASESASIAQIFLNSSQDDARSLLQGLTTDQRDLLEASLGATGTTIDQALASKRNGRAARGASDAILGLTESAKAWMESGADTFTGDLTTDIILLSDAARTASQQFGELHRAVLLALTPPAPVTGDSEEDPVRDFLRQEYGVEFDQTGPGRFMADLRLDFLVDAQTIPSQGEEPSLADQAFGRDSGNAGARIVEDELARLEAAVQDKNDRIREAHKELVADAEEASAAIASAWRGGVNDTITAIDDYNAAAARAGQATIDSADAMGLAADAAAKDVGVMLRDEITSGMGDAVGALIDGEKTAKQAFASMAREALKAVAMESTVKAIFQYAEAIAAFASLNVPKGTQHLVSAATYTAAAALAGAGAAAIPRSATGERGRGGGRGAGRGGADPAIPQRGGGRTSSDRGRDLPPIVVNVGTALPIATTADIGRAVNESVDAAIRRDG